MTYIIKRKEIEKVLLMNDVISIVEEAFKLYSDGKVQMPAKSYLIFDKGDLRSMPTYLPESFNIAGIKCVNVHPDNGKINLPTVMATIILVDPDTGENLAIMDGTFITNMRTGAVGGIAAKHLSREDSKAVGFVGAGEQAKTQLDAIRLVRDIKYVKVYDANQARAKLFYGWARSKFNVNCFVSENLESLCKDVDIIVTTTPSRVPLVKKEFVNEGTHINAVGADAQRKQELESLLVKESKLVIDNWEQASHSGEINVPLSEGLITKNNIYSELGDIISGKKKGRENKNEITIFDSTGLAIQDISTAYLVYQKLKGERLLSVDLIQDL